MLEQVLHALRRVKLDPVRLESDVSAAISRAMNVAGIPFETEVKLEQGSRVDFLARGGKDSPHWRRRNNRRGPEFLLCIEHRIRCDDDRYSRAQDQPVCRPNGR